MTLAAILSKFGRYSTLYGSQSSAAILRQFLALPPGTPIPLSLSHGVDYGHERYPQDALDPEPLHWCYNDRMLRHLGNLKPGVLLPHPWLLLEAVAPQLSKRCSQNLLLVGPPPSATNDRALVELLESTGLSPEAILVKSRGGAKDKASRSFWAARGIRPVSAAPGPQHLRSLHSLLVCFRTVALPVFSSVGVFAAASGCEIILMRPYAHCSYSPKELDLERIIRSPTARAVFRAFAAADSQLTRAVCREVLGADLQCSPDDAASRVMRAAAGVKLPVHVPSARGPLGSLLRAELALRLRRRDFLKYGLRAAMRYKLTGIRSALVWKRVDLLDALERGQLDASNLQTRSLRPHEGSVRSAEGADL